MGYHNLQMMLHLCYRQQIFLNNFSRSLSHPSLMMRMAGLFLNNKWLPTRLASNDVVFSEVWIWIWLYQSHMIISGHKFLKKLFCKSKVRTTSHKIVRHRLCDQVNNWCGMKVIFVPSHEHISPLGFLWSLAGERFHSNPRCGWHCLFLSIWLKCKIFACTNEWDLVPTTCVILRILRWDIL